MNKVSIYMKSGRQSACPNYRYIQYFDYIECNKKYRKMIPDYIYSRCMPISRLNILFRVILYFYFLLRVIFQLVADCFWKPDVVVISRRLINRSMPRVYCWLLKIIKKKATIIWDFDDNILESKEVTPKTFAFFSKVSDKIIVASPVLKELIADNYRYKVEVLVTTDGDIFRMIETSVIEERLRTYDNVIKLLWVGTSVSIDYVKEIMPHIESLSKRLKNNNKKVEFTFVCDKPLVYTPTEFSLHNIKWSHDSAIKEFVSNHVGLMPLQDNTFTRGKGGFKLIQYMSAALPVVGSKVGINIDIITPEVGFIEDNLDSPSWIDDLFMLASDREFYKKMSAQAYRKYNSCYSYTDNLKYWKSLVL